MHVCVVGAGIIGASISRHLAQRGGVKVTVLEAAPAPATGATGASWAWLNANAKHPRHYRDLNLASMQLWQSQHTALCTFNGCLMLHDERAEAAADAAYPSRHVAAGAELQALAPGLDAAVAASCQHALLYAQEGWCDPAAATAAFLEDAHAAGARMLFSHKVQAVTMVGGRAARVVCSLSSSSDEQHELPVDAVVLAAGVGVAELSAQLGHPLPLLDKPAAVVLTRPLQPGLLRGHMLVTDTVFILQRADGSVLMGETRPAAASNTDTSSSNAQRILQLAAKALPVLASADVAGMSVGFRPYPADGYPCCGWLPRCANAYVAVTHSGMTLAPLLGQLATDEVMAQLQPGSDASSGLDAASLLAPYRPGRNFVAAAAPGAAAGLNWASALQPVQPQS